MRPNKQKNIYTIGIARTNLPFYKEIENRVSDKSSQEIMRTIEKKYGKKYGKFTCTFKSGRWEIFDSETDKNGYYLLVSLNENKY